MGKIEDYFRKTPAARAAARGSVSCRPHHDDWPEHNLTEIADFITANPYIKDTLGPRIDVSVQQTKDKRTIMFVVMKH